MSETQQQPTQDEAQEPEPRGPEEAAEAAPEEAASEEAASEEAASEEAASEEAAPDEAAAADEADEAAEEAEAEEPTDDGKPGPSKAKPDSVSREHLKSILESLVFVADKPVPARVLSRATRSKKAEVTPLLEELAEEYRGRGIELVEVGGGWQFRSAAANAPFVRDFVQQKPVRLTRAQLEALAIMGYRQPVTRPELEEIRGVDSGSALKVLLDRGLVKILGRKEEPGRPLLYGTTPYFLEFFGLASLKDLPTLREFSELSEESRALFERRMGEPIDLQGVEDAVEDVEARSTDQDLDADEDLDDDEPRDEDDEDADDEEEEDAEDDDGDDEE